MVAARVRSWYAYSTSADDEKTADFRLRFRSGVARCLEAHSMTSWNDLTLHSIVLSIGVRLWQGDYIARP